MRYSAYVMEMATTSSVTPFDDNNDEDYGEDDDNDEYLLSTSYTSDTEL